MFAPRAAPAQRTDGKGRVKARLRCARGRAELDGKRLAGSVFKAMLKDALGIPLRQPRIVRLDEPDLR